MTNDAVRHLADFRVRKPGNEDYKSLPLTGEQESCRRTYMRQMLQKTQWADAQDDIVDNMRVWGEDANGFFVEDSSMCEFYIPEKRVDAQMAQFRRSRSMIPFEYMNLLLPSFDWRKYGYDTRETQKIVRSFVVKFEEFRQKGMGLYIYSETKGSGKTMLASILLNELSRHYAISVKFVTVLDLIEMTKQSFHDDSGEVQSLYDAGVLVLDDLGVQMKKDWIDSVLYRLIDHRYRRILVTIYTSNIQCSNLRIDERITDRMNKSTIIIHLPEVPKRYQDKQLEKQEFLKKVL